MAGAKKDKAAPRAEQVEGEVVEGTTDVVIRDPSITIEGSKLTVRGVVVDCPYKLHPVGSVYVHEQNWASAKDAQWGFDETLAKWKRQLARAKAKTKTKPKKSRDRSVATSLARLATVADQYRCEVKPPKGDGDLRLRAPKPCWGKIPPWKLPPSYRELVALHSRLWVKWGDDEGHGEYIVLTPKEMRETSGIVYMPKDVSYDPGKYITTNHLVPFASAGDDECAFCFDVLSPAKDGEYPVYYHHQDEPRARYQATGKWVEAARPDFPNFGAWLAWIADELTAGHGPPRWPGKK